MSEFIQVGMTAMRDPLTGKPLEAVPLYVEVIKGQVPPLPEFDRADFARTILKKIRAQRETEEEKNR